MKVLVSGAAGSIGSALVKTLLKRGYKVIALDNNETGIFDLEELRVKTVIASIRDEEALDLVFRKFKPDWVIHCAAYKHVLQMEKWPLEAIKTNIGGTINIMQSALKYSVKKFVFVSTDKAVEPSSVMGLTKKYGEKLCVLLSGRTKFIAVRFGNVMPSRGSVVPIFEKQIKENKPLQITSPKMKRFFMGIYDAAGLVLKAAQMGKGGEIFVLDMGREIYIKDLAKLMVKLSGKDLPVVFTQPNQAEKFREKTMTSKEKKRAHKKDGLFIIRDAGR